MKACRASLTIVAREGALAGDFADPPTEAGAFEQLFQGDADGFGLVFGARDALRLGDEVGIEPEALRLRFSHDRHEQVVIQMDAGCNTDASGHMPMNAMAAPPDTLGKRRARLLAVCALAAGLGIFSKLYTGPGRAVAVAQGEDFFGTLFLILFPRVFFLRAALWKIAGVVLVLLVAIELSQLVHSGGIERVRAHWLGRHIVGTTFEWADLLMYALGALTALWIDRRLARNT